MTDEQRHLSLPIPMVVGHVCGQRTGQPLRMTHRQHTLSLLVQGDGYYEVGPSTGTMVAPSIQFLPAGEVDVNGLYGSVDNWFCSFEWSGIAIRSIDDNVVTIDTGAGEIPLARRQAVDADAASTLVECFRRLARAVDGGRTADKLRARALLMELVIDYCEFRQMEPMRKVHRALNHFYDLLRRHACSQLTIRDLAAQVGMSVDHLRQLFIQEFGVTPQQFRNERRMAHARDMLTSEGMNVSEAADACGFADASYFSRRFRNHYGIPPTDLIRRCRMQ